MDSFAIDGGCFEPAVASPEAVARDALVFAFDDRRLLTHDHDATSSSVPTVGQLAGLRIPLVRRLFLGRLDGREIYTAEVASEVASEVAAEGDAASDTRGGTKPAGRERTIAPPARQSTIAPLAQHGLRGLFGRISDPLFWIAARAIQVLEWDRDHQFCGRCAAATAPRTSERSRVCPDCGLSHYPRLAPAVIVLIHDDDRLLLARSPHFPAGMYSTLAGFVEPGERLEETVEREIQEEVGVRVANVRYFGSQPWPFPHSLMIGFTAAYAGGDLAFGGDGDGEIEHADWFTLDALPRIPPRISIARALIDGYLDQRGERSRQLVG